MCVKIVYKNGKTEKFDEKRSVKDQINNVKMIEIDFKNTEKDTKEVQYFVSELQTCTTNIQLIEPFDVEFNAHNFLPAIKLKKELNRIKNNISVLWIAHTIAANNQKLDNALEELEKTINESKKA